MIPCCGCGHALAEHTGEFMPCQVIGCDCYAYRGPPDVDVPPYAGPARCEHGIPRNSIEVGCVVCPCPELGDGKTYPHQWEDDWCRQCGVERDPHQGGTA